MKTIDNFDRIINYIKKSGPKAEDNMYMTVIIVQRQKDFNVKESDKKTLKKKIKESPRRLYYIRTWEDLERNREEIVAIARALNARVYINLSSKSYITLRNQITLKLVENMTTNQTIDLDHELKSQAMKLKSKNPVWLIDVDHKEDEQKVMDWLVTNAPKSFIMRVPTIQNSHILVKKINSFKFNQELPGINLLVNPMGTMLYFESLYTE